MCSHVSVYAQTCICQARPMKQIMTTTLRTTSAQLLDAKMAELAQEPEGWDDVVRDLLY